MGFKLTSRAKEGRKLECTFRPPRTAAKWSDRATPKRNEWKYLASKWRTKPEKYGAPDPKNYGAGWKGPTRLHGNATGLPQFLSTGESREILG